MSEYTIEIYNGKIWYEYNSDSGNRGEWASKYVVPHDKEWASKLYHALSNAGVYCRIKDAEGNSVDPDELDGTNAILRCTPGYQLGWTEAWDYIEKTRGFCY